jgi:hypothetical protein
MDLGSKQAFVDPALSAHASAARVIRSCSRFCPPLSIVPNPAADPGADEIHNDDEDPDKPPTPSSHLPTCS